MLTMRGKIERQTNELSAAYHRAAERANADGIDAADETSLVQWIRNFCSYRPDTEYFLVLGIGSELADIQAQEAGYKNEVDRTVSKIKKQTTPILESEE